MRTQMQAYVEGEQYEEAARARDLLREAERREKDAKTALGEWGVSDGGVMVYKYALGQCVTHERLHAGVVA